MAEIRTLDALPEHVQQAIATGVARTYCPQCDGGKSREASLSIRQTEDAVLKLSCWRSTCDWWALVPTDPTTTVTRSRMTTASVYREDVRRICDSPMLTDLAIGYGLRADVMSDHGWGTTGDTLVMPILSPTGGVRGHVTRTFDTPKRCMTYKNTAQPWLDWWPMFPDQPVVVVEDCLSACRLRGLGFTAVALQGTGITVEQAQEISSVAAGVPVYLALDNDAFEKALKLAARHRHIVPMRPVLLTQDIKNIESDYDIRKLFT